MATDKDKPKNTKEGSYNSNITEEERKMLDQENVHKDGGVDEQLRDRTKEIDFSGRNLDVPGRETAKKGNGTGLNDEENKVHSQGGPGNENLEEQDGKINK